MLVEQRRTTYGSAQGVRQALGILHLERRGCQAHQGRAPPCTIPSEQGQRGPGLRNTAIDHGGQAQRDVDVSYLSERPADPPEALLKTIRRRLMRCDERQQLPRTSSSHACLTDMVHSPVENPCQPARQHGKSRVQEIGRCRGAGRAMGANVVGPRVNRDRLIHEERLLDH